MLSSMVKEHQLKQSRRKEEQGARYQRNYLVDLTISTICTFFPESRRKETVEAANELTQALVDHLNVG